MTEPMDAVPTTYAGTRFRSRLEADWAVTLDGLGILWEYEPELIVLPSGTRYVPDFWLPEVGTWLEVKGPNTPRREKATELGKVRACHCTSAWSGRPRWCRCRRAFSGRRCCPRRCGRRRWPPRARRCALFIRAGER
ncbi:hypothetical protein GCM10010384_68040 [Streptomyces djakartensis]|uniref:TnsA endonuclease N-terminal domain-containing protein n=1 Tax=Streptomyces djakartensis TaxID=68193 RepID=A0ABQ3AKV8_9ACTN|nr:hypothetical protein GCM10010384_68040 [Streptomyces djakartensis]